ncbi:hypothetical protein ACO22_02147 [Paracoccidioides brasiliensis]|uniref:Uncharacterized protein n=1 Tax=Paracoccidioides brasiliensis TaxID=121759 RepID=A0A1D2JJK5_PARBR|nr:hypothetical protein ACO22_02147 [Paracoccidioides brasiliensis]
MKYCTNSDFTDKGSCSQACIAELEALSRSLNIACIGSRALAESLIGLFFQSLGVQTLCPNAVIRDGGGSGVGEERTSQDPGPTDTQLLPSSETRTPQPTPTETETGEVSSRTTRPPSVTTSAATRVTSIRSTSITTIMTSILSTTTSVPAPPTPTTPESSSSSSSTTTTTTTTATATATRTRAPTKDPFGGFGNAFDIIAPNKATPTLRSSRSWNMAIGVATAKRIDITAFMSSDLRALGSGIFNSSQFMDVVM